MAKLSLTGILLSLYHYDAFLCFTSLSLYFQNTGTDVKME